MVGVLVLILSDDVAARVDRGLHRIRLTRDVDGREGARGR